jgi:hypothetical protein
MTQRTMHENFVGAVLFALDEAFDNVHGIFLDKNTSLFETLATISAEEASRPVSPTCATLAAQVNHVAFYLERTYDWVKNANRDPVDWGEIWRTVREVTPEEWEAAKARLRAAYDKTKELVTTTPDFNDQYVIGGTLGVLMHTAYHLGEIRQALCTLKAP